MSAKKTVRKVKSLKPRSVSDEKEKAVKGGFPVGPPQVPVGPAAIPKGLPG